MSRYYFITIIFCIGKLYSQPNLNLYWQSNIEQKIYTNPSAVPVSKIHVGLPVLSSLYFNAGNTGFKYSDLIEKTEDDSLQLNVPNMLNQLKKNNYLNTNLQVDIFSFGIKLKKNYISINLRERTDIRFRYPKDFFNFLWYGNAPLVGEQLNFNFGVDFIHFREYGVGFSRDINEKLRLGARFKYLYGMENIHTEKSDIFFKTDETDYSLIASTDIIIRTSGIVSDSTKQFNMKEYLLGKKNTGMSFDIGATYKFSERITLSASIIDMGYINWKTDVKNYSSEFPNGEFKFSGINLNQYVQDSGQSVYNAIDVLLDTLGKSFNIISTEDNYKYALSSSFYLAGEYQLGDEQRAGALIFAQWFDGAIYPALSFSHTTDLTHWFSTTFNYSIINRSYNNLGAGIRVNIFPVQFYIITDNIFGALFPHNTRFFNVRTGINLTFGNKEKETNESAPRIE